MLRAARALGFRCSQACAPLMMHVQRSVCQWGTSCELRELWVLWQSDCSSAQWDSRANPVRAQRARARPLAVQDKHVRPVNVCPSRRAARAEPAVRAAVKAARAVTFSPTPDVPRRENAKTRVAPSAKYAGSALHACANNRHARRTTNASSTVIAMVACAFLTECLPGTRTTTHARRKSRLTPSFRQSNAAGQGRLRGTLIPTITTSWPRLPSSISISTAIPRRYHRPSCSRRFQPWGTIRIPAYCESSAAKIAANNIASMRPKMRRCRQHRSPWGISMETDTPKSLRLVTAEA